MGRKREIGSRSATQISLRLPDDLKRRVADAADLNGRSNNTEIIIRLEDSFSEAGQISADHSVQAGLDEIRRELAAIKREIAKTQEMISNQK